MGTRTDNSLDFILMRKYAIVASVLILIALDILSKYYFERLLSYYETISILSDFITLKLSYNNGIAFSLPVNGILLKIITLLILWWIGAFYVSEEYPKKSGLLDIGYSLVLAWAISHAYERVFIWHVVDFIAVKYFAILNFADIFISVGAFFLIIAYGISRRHAS